MAIGAKGAATGPGGASNDFRLPLVSVIVTAHDYGRFLGAAIASVLGQSYRDIEMIIVDDGSSDETPDIVREAVAGSPSISAITNPRPLGQGGASRIGFNASRGDYVVFMDADDVLLPDFVRDHVFVNLSSRVSVGCTSSDIYQVVDGRLVVASGEALNVALRDTPCAPAAAFRPLAAAPAGPWLHDGPDATLLQGIRYVPPGQTQWRWSPMTANMFRRDALTLLVDCDEFAALGKSTDVYLCTGASLLCGSLLIDKPLSWYRIHGKNMGTHQAQLTNVRAVRAEAEWSWRAKELLFEHLTRNARDISARLWTPQPLLDALRALDLDLAQCGSAPHVAQCLERNRDSVIAAVGEAGFTHWRPSPTEPEMEMEPDEEIAPAPDIAEPSPPVKDDGDARPAVADMTAWWARLIPIRR
jgi:glycosyltransferase involved in cell wall biosynthesis